MMRIVISALVLLACGFPLQADNLLQNGDFTDGSAHWQGDGKSLKEYSQGNPAAINNPLLSKGLLVPLNPQAWTKIRQDFKGDKNTHYLLNVTYKVSDDLSLSSKADDYANVNDHVRFEGYDQLGPINIEVGKFFVTVINPGDCSGYYERFSPQLTSKDVQSFVDPGQPLTPMGNDMVTLAFPPGKGTVVILSVSVTSS